MRPSSDDTRLPPGSRRLACERCGTAFTCNVGGHCWCMDEEVRVPLPTSGDGGDCLCRDCLRALAPLGDR